jgi:hypothetical protein
MEYNFKTNVRQVSRDNGRWLWLKMAAFLGAIAEVRKMTVSFLSFCLSACKNSAPKGRIFMQFDIWEYFENL